MNLVQALVMGVALALVIYAVAVALHTRSSSMRTCSIGRVLIDFWNTGLRRCSLILVGVGLLGVIAALILQLVAKREGVLQSEELYTFRMPKELEVAHLTKANLVSAGDLIATFRSPEHEAEQNVLQLKCESSEAERKIVESEPVIPDAKLVQRQREVDAEHRHLRSAMEQYTIEHSEVRRQRVREVQAKREQIIELQGMLDQLPQERLKTQAELTFKSSELVRAKTVYAKNALTEQEYEEVIKEVAVLASEVERLVAQQASTRQEETQAKVDLRELEGLMDEQTARFDRKLVSLREQLTLVTQQRTQIMDELKQDVAKAKERKQARLKQIQLDIEQHKNKIAGLERMLKVTAPISGRVAHRNPSPGTAYTNDPLLVIAPSDALRFQMRLPVAQARALQAKDFVSLELSRRLRKGDDVEVPPQPLVSRFAAQPLSSRKLEHDPNMVLVEFECDPPEEAVRDLALGEVVRAELVDIPPLFTLPLFVLGAVPMTIGAMGFLTVRLRRGVNRDSRQSTYEPAPANATLRAAEPDAVALRLLGEQLGEMIRDGEVDPSLLATCEWTLDRHGLQVARIIGEGVRESVPLAEDLERMISRFRRNGSPVDPDVLRSEELLDRLISLLETISPDEISRPSEPTVPRRAR